MPLSPALQAGDAPRLARTSSALKPLTVRPRAWILADPMLRLLVALLPTFRSALRSRRNLVIENLALRNNLPLWPATPPGDSARRPALLDPAAPTLERVGSLAIVQPDTVLRWHRAGFRTYWNWLSRRGGRSGRPPLPSEVRAIMRRMATENHWGAPRVRGELFRLGIIVSERSVSRYLRSLPPFPKAGQTWTTFLRNHRDGIAAMDFFSVPTVTFRVLQVLVVIRHGRRVVARCGVTAFPTSTWVVQQVRETFPFDSAPRFMIFDRGAVFSAGVTATLRSLLVEPTRTSYRSSWQNGIAERFVATVRRELLNHVIVLNERHLRQLIAAFVTYYNQDRTHLGIGKDSPCGRPVEQRPSEASNVVGLPRVGGLHHRYAWRQAA
jgi:transposase InsO family protein